MSAGVATPLMQQYREIKSRHSDSILFFRMGDFYEMFYDDAEVASRVLGLTLTSRNNGGASEVPLAGIPVKAANEYLRRLVRQGYRVAICEQVEDPRLAKGIVRREVVETITPGAAFADDLLDGARNNFLCALHRMGESVGVAAVDVSTGELRLVVASSPPEVEAALARLGPREIIIGRGLPDALASVRGAVPEGALLTEREGWEFDPDNAAEDLRRQFGVLTLEGFGLGVSSGDAAAVGAAGALVRYLRELQPAGLPHLARPVVERAGSAMPLDEMTRRNLELVESLRGGAADTAGTLIDVLDRTLTPMGSRLLRQWLLAPLIEAGPIESRLDAVGALARNAVERQALREALDGVRDIERLASKAAAGRASPRELGALGASIVRMPLVELAVRRICAAGTPGNADAFQGVPAPGTANGVKAGSVAGLSSGSAVSSSSGSVADSTAGIGAVPGPAAAGALTDLLERWDGCAEVGESISGRLVERPPNAIGEEAAIRPGVDAGLDELRELRDGGRDAIARIQTDERARTGISSLKVGFNRVFGYYIEISNANRALVPDNYQRRQTLTGAERYVTPELKEFEEKVLSAAERIESKERELFEALRAEVGAQISRLQCAARVLAELDVLAALAEVSEREGYVRPEITRDFELDIRGGRHPVVERMMPRDKFIPNDVLLTDDARLIILTGPNMAGKSTILRQVGLIVLMAQIGSFVPAARARIGIVDRLFTRVGASDNLARGQSTFMVEMSETSAILHSATSRSLVLLDEIGRGTSTYDGVSIAWAVSEHVHDVVGCKTIFATHYHELTQLSDELSGLRNFNVAVQEVGEEVLFLHRLQPGGASRSYGIEVGRLAGLPAPVISRARAVLQLLEGDGEQLVAGLQAGGAGTARGGRPGPRPPGRGAPPVPATDQLALFSSAPDPVVEELRNVDVNTLTPLEAITLLGRLSDAARDGGVGTRNDFRPGTGT